MSKNKVLSFDSTLDVKNDIWTAKTLIQKITHRKFEIGQTESVDFVIKMFHLLSRQIEKEQKKWLD